MAGDFVRSANAPELLPVCAADWQSLPVSAVLRTIAHLSCFKFATIGKLCLLIDEKSFESRKKYEYGMFYGTKS